MAIYTKVGDGGDTYRPGGLKTRKGDPFIEALGGLDEMNANVGFCLQALRKRNSKKSSTHFNRCRANCWRRGRYWRRPTPVSSRARCSIRRQSRG